MVVVFVVAGTCTIAIKIFAAIETETKQIWYCSLSWDATTAQNFFLFSFNAQPIRHSDASDKIIISMALETTYYGERANARATTPIFADKLITIVKQRTGWLNTLAV